VDIYERAGNLVVKVDLPGVRKDDLEVALERGDLVIHGERKPEGELKDEDYYRAERPVGRFYRRMPLPFEASPEQVRASFTDGVLDISIPKPPEEPPQPQKISVA
jgi:HSP20 family protein